MGRLDIRNLRIGYRRSMVIDRFDLTVAHGTIATLLGPSGAGKTTLLKAIAGLLRPLAGDILINGKSIIDKAPEQRDTVLIFQNPLLFPFLDVRDNIGFGLKMQGIDVAERNRRVDRMIEITGLAGLESGRIHQLSGGQQQRVALARGLVLEPSLLLLDEPLSNLDAGLRSQMRDQLIEIQKKTKTTMLLVTHDQIEALTISDTVCLLLEGRLRQTGSPAELFHRPADPEVAGFFGSPNLIPGIVADQQFSAAICSAPAPGYPPGQALATIRPEDIEISATRQPEFHQGKLEKITFEGACSVLQVDFGRLHLTVQARRPDLKAGEPVWVRLPPEFLHLF